MTVPKEVEFAAHKRKNVFAAGGVEYALDVRLPGGTWWTLTKFEEPPSKVTLETHTEATMRAMEFYHRECRGGFDLKPVWAEQ